jgi:histone H3/H4
MMQSDKTGEIKLRALVVFCDPQDAEFCPVSELKLPQNVDQIEVAVSKSAQEKGYFRKLSLDYKVYTELDEESLFLKINSYDFILVHPLSLNTLAKLSLGISDSFPTRLLIMAIESNRPILLSEEFKPEPEKFANPHFSRIYKNYWENLIVGNVSSFSSENLESKLVRIIRSMKNSKNIVSNSGRTFITSEDIIAAADSLQPLRIPSSAIVTAVAEEEASKLGVIIIRE